LRQRIGNHIGVKLPESANPWGEQALFLGVVTG